MSASLWINFVILCLIGFYIRGGYTQNENLDVAVVEDNLQVNETESQTMPSKLNMTINLFHNETNAVDLKLDMNKAMNEQRSIYVIRMDKNGKPVLRKQQVPIEANVAFYQDKKAGANVMVTCDGFDNGHCDPSLEGSFYMNNVEYGLEPMELDSLNRTKRSVLEGRRSNGKLYSIFKRKQEKPVKDDFETNPDLSSSSGQSMQLVDRVVDLRDFLTEPSASMEMRRRVSDVHVKSPPRNARRKNNYGMTPYEMGLVVIVDFSMYQNWYRRSGQRTHAERDIEAKSKIRQYMAHVINGVDLRFQNLRGIQIKIVVSRYIIADSPEASPWTATRTFSTPRDLLYADDALNELIKWRYRMSSELPLHDHTILFTGHDLYRPTIANKGVAGFARVKSMCTHSSVSVVEEHGGFGSILTATHEIGHSLGAYHDGHNNTCVGEDNFIMTPIGGSATPSNALNPFQFSECSEESFQTFIDSLPPNNCLTDETEIYDLADFQNHIQQEAGQLYDPNQQCKQHLGDLSYYAWGGILGESEEVCTHMACKNSMSSTSFNIYYAARGTSCGDKKWCIDGVCTYAEEAPRKDGHCVHGDSRKKFGDMTCAEYVNADPSRCYFHYFKRFCCETCKKLKGNEKGCEYGNRKRKCDHVDKEGRFCYKNNNERRCCGSCSKHHTGIKGCEYGDKIPDCDPSQCSDDMYSKQCCKTCSGIKIGPKLLVPAVNIGDSILLDHVNIKEQPTSTLPPMISTKAKPTTSTPPTVLPPNSQLSLSRKQQDKSLIPPRKIKGIIVSHLGPVESVKPKSFGLNEPTQSPQLELSIKEQKTKDKSKPAYPDLSRFLFATSGRKSKESPGLKQKTRSWRNDNKSMNNQRNKPSFNQRNLPRTKPLRKPHPLWGLEIFRTRPVTKNELFSSQFQRKAAPTAREQQRRRRQRQLQQQRFQHRHGQQQQKRGNLAQNRVGQTQIHIYHPNRTLPPTIFHVKRFPAKSKSSNALDRLRQNFIKSRKPPASSPTKIKAPYPPILQNAPPRSKLIPVQQLCAKKDATIASIKCEHILQLFLGVCSNPILQTFCCEPCRPPSPPEPVCADEIDCDLTAMSQCYDQTLRSKCCATCKKYETEYPDCLYGDRQRHCDVVLRFIPDLFCNYSKFKRQCCLTCENRRPSPTTTISPFHTKVSTVAWGDNMWENSFHQEQRQLYRDTRNAVLPWN